MRPAVRRALLVGLAATLAAPGSLPAQSPKATSALHGRLVAAGTTEPLPFTVVALLPAGGGLERRALTAADGSFEFDSVAPGEYRVRVARVGFAPELQPPLHVSGARAEPVIVRSAARPDPSPAALRTDTLCRDPAELEHVPGLAALWRDAATAAEARRLFGRAYSFTLVRRELNWMAAGANRVRASVAEEPVTHTPEDAFVEELRASSPESVWGSATGGLQLLVPDLPQLFGRGFLATHCVVAAVGEGGGYRLSFVVRGGPTVPGAVRVAAALVLDSTDVVTRLDVEYRADGRVVAHGAYQFTDAGFPGGQLRFPSRLDLEEVPRLAGATHWVGRHRYDNYRIARDTAH